MLPSNIEIPTPLRSSSPLSSFRPLWWGIRLSWYMGLTLFIHMNQGGMPPSWGWETIQVRQYISLATVVVLGWEYILTISHEYTYIWRSRLTITKWLFLLLRYVTLISQITNHVVSTVLFSRPNLDHATCDLWFRVQGAVTYIIIALFELILILRVFALYGNSRNVGMFLLLAMGTEISVVVFFAIRLHRLLRYDETCLLQNTPIKEAFALGAAVVTMQTLLWSMTWYKQATHHPTVLSRGPVVSVVFRDGLLVFIAVSSLLIFLVCFSVFVHDLTHNVWSVLATLLSVTGCRVIMNIQRLKFPQADSEVELTTIFLTSSRASAFTWSAPMTTEEEGGFDGTDAEFPLM